MTPADRPLCRGGDRYGHHDLSRRHRHQSGLALPAISDSFDAFEILGLDRTEGGQVSGGLAPRLNLMTNLSPSSHLQSIFDCRLCERSRRPGPSWSNKSPSPLWRGGRSRGWVWCARSPAPRPPRSSGTFLSAGSCQGSWTSVLTDLTPMPSLFCFSTQV